MKALGKNNLLCFIFTFYFLFCLSTYFTHHTFTAPASEDKNANDDRGKGQVQQHRSTLGSHQGALANSNCKLFALLFTVVTPL